MKTRMRPFWALAAAFTAAALAVCLPPYGQVSAEAPTFDPDVRFRPSYGAGYTLVIPSIAAAAGDETLPVGAVLTCGGETVATLGTDETQVKYRLNGLGEYRLTYFAEYNGETYTRSFSFVVEDKPYFEHSLAWACPLGTELPLDAVAVYKGERKQAEAAVGGRPAAGVYRAVSLGTVAVTFTASFGGKEYAETTEVAVRLTGYDDLFGGAGVTSVTANVQAPDYMRPGGGVRVMAAAPGSVVRYANTIDLNALDPSIDLIKFIPLSGGDYAPLKQVIVRLRDVYDPSNTVQWRFYSVTWEAGDATSYCGFNYDGREMGRFNEGGDRFGEVRSDWMTQLPNGTFDINRTGNPPKTDRMWFAAQTDYSSRRFYVTSEMPAGEPWLILDADDSKQVGVGKEWKEFTTGEVNLELVFDGSGKTGVLVSEIAGQPLDGARIADSTPPSVLTDYPDDGNMPLGRVGQPYPIPAAARVLDAVEGMLDSSVVSVRLLKTEGILTRDITDRIQGGAFTPTEAGSYRIEYAAADSSGNKSRRYVAFDVSAESAPIEVTCPLPAAAFVGETLNLPDVTVTGMTTLTKKTVRYAYNGREIDLPPGSDLLLKEAGELTLDYELVDYVSNRRAATLTTVVTVSPDPVLTVRGMPETAIRGRKLLIPDFTAYDYNYGADDPRREPVKSITVNGKRVDVNERVYEVTERAGSALKVVFTAGRTAVEKTVEVVSPSMLSDYFITESENEVTPMNAADALKFGFEGDLTVRPVNPSAVNNFAGFPIDFDVVGAGVADVRMTDFLRPYKSIFFRVDFNKRTVSINGAGTAYPLAEGRVSLRYKSVGHLLAGYGVIRSWTDGTPFDGFSGGVASLEWRLSGFGAAELTLTTLGMTELKTKTVGGVPQHFEDNAAPAIVLASSVYDQQAAIGQSFTVPAASAWSALSGACEVVVSLYDAAGDKVIDRVRANRDYYWQIDDYGVWLLEYRVTYADGAVDEKTMPVTVKSALPPTVTLSAGIAESYAAGAALVLPQVSVTGVGTCAAYYSLTRPDGTLANFAPGAEVKLEAAGEYRLTVVAEDDWNYAVRHYAFTVK